MGITTHSMQRSVFIFSAYKGTMTKFKNELRHIALMNFLRNVDQPFKEVQGMYNGEVEDSVVVTGMAEEDVASLSLKMLGQECYMRLDNYKHGQYKATLVYADKQVEIGYLREVTRDDIIELNLDYTYCPVMNKYWAVTEQCITQPSMWEEYKNQLKWMKL